MQAELIRTELLGDRRVVGQRRFEFRDVADVVDTLFKRRR